MPMQCVHRTSLILCKEITMKHDSTKNEIFQSFPFQVPSKKMKTIIKVWAINELGVINMN